MEKENKNPKRKISEFLITLFYFLSTVGILTVLIVGTVMHLGPVLSVVLLGLILLVILLLHRSVKKEDRQKAEYREKYVSEISLQHPLLGELKFERDSVKNTLTCQEGKIPFGDYFPRLCIDGYEESLNDFFCRNLEFLYSRQAEIIKNLFALCTEDFSMSLEALQKSFSVTCIHMLRYEEYLLGEDSLEIAPGDWIITVSGNPDVDHEGYYITPTAYMDCRTQKIDYMTVE